MIVIAFHVICKKKHATTNAHLQTHVDIFVIYIVSFQLLNHINNMLIIRIYCLIGWLNDIEYRRILIHIIANVKKAPDV